MTAEEAAGLIGDGMTVCPVGMTLVGVPEGILRTMEKRFPGGGLSSGSHLCP